MKCFKEDKIVNELRELFNKYFLVNKISRHYYHMANGQDYAYIKNKIDLLPKSWNQLNEEFKKIIKSY